MNQNEDKAKIPAEFVNDMKWASSLSKEQIAFLCDGGWYNNTIRGYLIKAAEYADFTDEQISVLLEGLNIALDNYDKEAAEKVYLNR